LSHEQYRPFVLFHRVQATALANLEEQGAESAIQEINVGLDQFRALFARYDAAEQFSEDELVRRLESMRESVRTKYDIGQTLEEQLAAAVRAEDYERAASLRDMMRSRPSAVARGGAGTDLGNDRPDDGLARVDHAAPDV
jgi:hypothetical protein